MVIVSTVLTYIIPKGEFGTIVKDGETIVNYNEYIPISDYSGIPVWKGLLAPILLLGSSDGINIIMLSIFLIVIASTFQVMNDNNGVRIVVNRIIARFKNRKFLLLSIISLIFMLFGAMLGLFEEMLTLLPIVAILALSLGFDSFTGFIVSIVSCGFGFSSAITNPFTVLFASQIIGVNPMINIWYRIIIFVIMYGLMELFLLFYTKKIAKKPESSYTYEHDQRIKDRILDDTKGENDNRVFNSYMVFFAIVLATIIIFSSIDAIRDYTIVGLIVIFLIGGILTSLIASKFDFKATFKSFFKGALSVIPSLAFILLASSIKYILVEGKILPTITNTINDLVANKSIITVALILFLIILVLEFFISSSTAKAVFIMSILATLSLGLTKEMQVLIYTFADGYTNLLFPTSPVMLIGLSMIEVSYFKWLKKSTLLFAITFTLVIGLLILGILIGY